MIFKNHNPIQLNEYRILHLEDLLSDVDLVKRQLKKSNLDFQHFHADDEESFMRGLTEFKPNVILCDHSLPQFDSVMAFEIYREMKLDIPFILVTGSVSEEYAVKMIKKGIDDYLLKTNLQRLPQAIESSFANRANRRKVTEAEQQKEFERNNLSALINNTTDLIWSVDREMRLITCNKAFDDRVKQSTGKLIEKGGDVLEAGLSKESIERYKGYYARAFSGETFIEVEHSSFPDDSWSEVSFYPIRQGDEIIGTACYMRDITERKRVEEKLEKNTLELLDIKNELEYNEKRLKQAQAIAHVGNWEFNFTTNHLIWSTETCNIYGLQPEENEQSLDSFLSFVHPDDLFSVKKELEQSLASLSDASFYHRIIRKNGVVRYVHTESRFEFDGENKPIGLYGVIHDVTEEKKAEEKLKATNKELETFIYKASHDLRGPLASILGVLNIWKMENKGETKNKYLEIVESSTKKLDHTLGMLVQSMTIKDTSKFGEEINFTTLITEIIDKFEYYDGFQNIKITFDVSLAVPFICNKYILVSIFQNLIENAIKYRNRNNSQSFLKITVTGKNDKVDIEFRDNGTGIDKSLHDKVFDMYFKGTEISIGSGLGLYLVKTGVEKLNGHIELISEPGLGTTFRINFPNQKRN